MDGPVLTETYDISIIDRKEVSLDHFSVTERVPGTAVSDSTLPGAAKLKSGRVEYVVPPDVQSLDAVVEAALKGETLLIAPKGRTYWYYCVAVMFIILLSIAFRKR